MMRLAEYLFDVPLMLDGGKAATIAATLGPRLLGQPVIVTGAEAVEHSIYRDKADLSGRDMADHLRALAVYQGRDALPIINGVGVIGIEGSLISKGAFVGQSASGNTSYEGIRAQIARASQPDVKGVVFEVDSFGGMVNGGFETAARLKALSELKPTMAILTDFALSAGYLMASQARAIVMPQDGAAGSAGVITMHVDRSQQLENEGLKITVVKAGAHKDDGSPLGPLPDDVLNELQSRVDATRLRLADAIAMGRGGKMSAAEVLATEARVYHGADAVRIGFVDAIGDPITAFEAFVAAVNAAA